VRPALALHFSGGSSSGFGSEYARLGLSLGVFFGLSPPDGDDFSRPLAAKTSGTFNT
jgi:hypothetical protein